MTAPDRCPTEYSLAKGQAHDETWEIVITANGFAFQQDTGPDYDEPVSGAIPALRIPFGAGILIRNADTVSRTVESTDADGDVDGAFSVPLTAGETVPLRSPLPYGEEEDAAQLWDGPIGVQWIKAGTDRAKVEIFSRAALYPGMGAFQTATAVHPVSVGDAILLECVESSHAWRAFRLDSTGRQIAEGILGTDFSVNASGESATILDGNLVTDAPGQYVQIRFTCGQPYGGCCRTSESITRTGRYVGFQIWARDGVPSPVYPQYKKITEVNTLVGFTAAGEGPNGTYTTDDVISGGTRTVVKQISNVDFHVTQTPDQITYTGDWCGAEYRIAGGGVEYNIKDGGVDVDGDGIGDELNRFYSLYQEDWIYASTTDRSAKLWYEYQPGFDPDDEATWNNPVYREYAGSIRQTLSDVISWSEFIAGLTRLLTEPSELTDSEDAWDRILWPFTEYEAKWTDDGSIYLGDGAECNLCEGEDFSDINADDAEFCDNHTPTDYPTNLDCETEGNDWAHRFCCGNDFTVNTLQPERCDLDAAKPYEALHTPLWPDARAPDDRTPPVLHIPALVYLEVDDDGRGINITWTVVRNFWSGPYKRQVIERIYGLGDVLESETVLACEERLEDTGSLGPCPWYDDVSKQLTPMTSDPLATAEDTSWPNIVTELAWLDGLSAGATKILTVETTCPQYSNEMDDTTHTNPCG